MTDLEDRSEWKNCVDITGVRLPTGYYFGASAGTGDLSGECARLCCQQLTSFFIFPSLLVCPCWPAAVTWPLHLSLIFR